MAGTDGGREQRQCWGGETFSTHWQISLTLAPLHLSKQSARPQTLTLFSFDSGGEADSFPHAGPHSCMYIIVFDCVFLCVFYIILSQFHSHEIPPMRSENMGFVVTPLKKLKCLSRQKQSVEAHKYSCGCATDGSLFMQPQRWAQCSSLGLRNISVFPNGRLPLPPCWWPSASAPAKSWGECSPETHVG